MIPYKKPSSDWYVIYLGGYSVVVLFVYLYTMYPSVPGGDSGELIVAAHELGVAHPPGYPLFTLLLWSTFKIIPFGTVAWRANLLNAVLSAGATFVFSLTLYRYTRSIGLCIIGATMWSFNELTWTWSTTTEVFSLNNLCIACLLYLMVQFESTDTHRKCKVAYMGSFMCGISLCNQHTSVVYVAVIAVWVLYELIIIKELTVKVLLFVSFSFLFGLVPYIYLPLSSWFHSARYTWGNQSSIEGFMKHLLRQEYGTFSLAKEGDGSQHNILDGLRVYGWHVLSEFTVIGAVLVAAAVLYSIMEKRRCSSLLVTMVMCLLYLILFSWRANLNLDNQLFLGVVERFWMQSDMIIVLLAVVGLSAIFRSIETWLTSKSRAVIELTMAVAVFAMYMGKNFSNCNQGTNTVVAEFGSRLYHNMPQNALVLTVGDLPSNVLRYLYLCEDDRPDVTVLDQELMTYPWYVPMLRHTYPNVTFPGHHMEAQTGILDNGQQVFNFKTFLDANINRRPIIGCIGMQGHEKSWEQSYHLFPYGPCSLVVKAGGRLDIESIYSSTKNISDGWGYPNEGFDAKSWERVATNEIWNAKINVALKLYEMAVVLKETENMYSELMIKSYELYKAAVESEEIEAIPDYWHRNYALACERLLRIKHNYPLSHILNDTIFHFEKYIQKNPTDESVPIIKQSIKHLKSYVGKM
ncbi:protein O-mannosyl-transferase TMEM260-like isoform X2 [Ruditapes philippinarum]|uniref:protein O-mannosyl-transferase TMEM260-like isoform X2 n=1 Tax=Ruditapes philippinarum TaxID=129788 RepID=UPI00295BF02E|nr:protein O-mannosyl-transferase TMEM260-like isoform X2 [Ruditapes philippinarum]